MSKYENGFGAPKEGIEKIVLEGESVLWSGKPKKKAFITNKVLTMLPIALIWLMFDLGFIVLIFKSGAPSFLAYFLVPFFALHMIPVWMWLANVLTANRKWENTLYAVTDRRIIIQTGFIGMDYITIYYKEIADVSLKVGVIDKMLGVGDIHFRLTSATPTARTQVLLDLENAYEVYAKLQKIVLDIQADIHYPNDLRPNENSGYKTAYKG